MHFKCMHDIHFNEERTARNPKLIPTTLKWSQTSLVRRSPWIYSDRQHGIYMLAAFKGLGKPVLEITCATKEDLRL